MSLQSVVNCVQCTTNDKLQSGRLRLTLRKTAIDWTISSAQWDPNSLSNRDDTDTDTDTPIQGKIHGFAKNDIILILETVFTCNGKSEKSVGLSLCLLSSVVNSFDKDETKNCLSKYNQLPFHELGPMLQIHMEIIPQYFCPCYLVVIYGKLQIYEESSIQNLVVIKDL